MNKALTPALFLLVACGTAEVAPTDTDVDTDVAVESDAPETDVVDTDPTDVVVDPCDPDPCENGGTCTAVDDLAECACPDGFEGDTCASTPFFVGPTTETTLGDNWQTGGQYTRAQIYVATSHAPTTPTRITSVSFRRKVVENQTTAAFEMPAATVHMSHATASFDEVYADNIVGTPQEIYAGTHTVPPVGSDPLAFDAWTIDIDPPFAFDPAVGNLLLDVGMPTADGSTFVTMDCNNDGKVYMRMTKDAYDSTTGAPPTNSYYTTGCGFVMRLGVEAVD